ncbi:MAG: gliding motility-associated C-terminal domain-containing protein, partial [Bacteroidetes bacterium]
TGNGTIEYSINGGLTYQSSPTFTGLGPGTYEIAVRFTGSNCVNTNTATLGGQVVCVDTVLVSIPFETTTVYCLDASVFQVGTGITSASFCGLGNPNTVLAAALDDECITLDPADGFSGLSPDLICVVHCFDNDPNLCDTTIVEVVVQPADCSDMILEDSVAVNFMGNPTQICLGIPISDAVFLNGFLDGGSYTGGISGCDADSTLLYTYSFLFGGGFSGPYMLDSWVCNGGTFSGQFQDANDLVSLMNAFDPAGMWTIDIPTSTISGGAPGGTYGDMNITHIASGTESILMTNFNIFSNGTNIQVNGIGFHEFVFVDPNTGCADTVFIEIIGQMPTTDTLLVTTFTNTPTDDICVDGSELPAGFIESFGFCQLPANGGAPLNGDSCVIYIPDTDFVGTDTFCLLVCDTGNPQVCDSTFVVVTVLPAPDTLFLSLDDQAPVDTCLTDLIQLPDITTADICGINPDEISVTLNNDCLTLDPADDFVGTTEICVVHCDGNSPALCDTTTLIVTVADPCANVNLLPVASLTIESNDTLVAVCIPVSVAEAQLLDLQINGSPYTLPLSACTPEPPFTDGTTIFVNGPGIYELLATNADNCMDILTITVDSIPPAGCDPVFVPDSVTIESPTGPADFCMPLSFDQIGAWSVFINGSMYDGDLLSCDNGAGTQIQLDTFGIYQIVVTDTTGCADTATVSVIPEIMPPTHPDTVYVSTPMGVPIDELCFESDELTAPIAGIAFCQLPANGAAPVVSDSCVSYTPGAPFVGNDVFCVVVCDGNIPPNCDSIWVVVSVTPPTDLVMVEAPGTQPFDTCLTSATLQLPGNIASTEVCGAFPTEVSIQLNGECVNIDLEDNFTGTTEVCVIHCDDSTPSICDTTILVIHNDVICDEIFTEENLSIVSETPTVEVCIPIPPTEIDMYDVFVDGMPYNGSFAGCDADSAYVYSYALVFGQGNDGPYDVTWSAGGQNFMATVQNVGELVDSMNVWDPAGNWMLGMMSSSIISTNDAGDYGQMVFVHVPTMITTTIQANFIGLPMGTQVVLNGFGDHVLTVQNTLDGCEDLLNILLIDENETLQILTTENTVSDTFCLDTTGLTGVNAFIVCNTPENGTINIIGFDCFTYSPDPGFVGQDEACVAVCDTTGFCDTTYVFITVEPICSGFDIFGNDTLQLTTDNCQLPASYCAPVPLDVVVGLTILDNGEVYNGGIAGCDNDTCLAYTYFTIPGLGNEGPYELTNWTIDGVGSFSAQFDDIHALVDSMNLWDDQGMWTLDTTLFIITNCNTIHTYNDIAVEQISTGANAIAVLSTQLFPNGTQIQLDTGFHEMVFIDVATGCEDTLLVQVNCDEPPTGCGITAISPTILPIDNCDSTAQFCVDVSIFDAGNFAITDNGALYTEPLFICDLDPSSIAIVLDTGIHQLVLADTIKGCSDTFQILVSCLNIEDIVIEEIIPVGDEQVYCPDDFGLDAAVIDSITVTCPDLQTGNAGFEIDPDTWCLTITGLSEGPDTSCFEVWFSDTSLTVTTYIEVTAPCTQDLFAEDVIGQGMLDCSGGQGPFCLPVSLLQMQTQRIEVNGVAYTGPVSGCNFDSTFTINCALLPSGGNLGPYILDQWTINGMDTTGVFEDCAELVTLLNQLDPTGTWEQVGDLIVGGNPNTVYGNLQVTQDVTGATVNIGIGSSFVPLGTSITLPVGTFTLTFQDTTTGCRDTLIATLACLSSDVFTGTVPVGQTDTLCLDASELSGNLTDIQNICAEDGGEFVVFETLNDTCLIYTGIEPGLDSACYILCDDTGLCDTTYIYITATSSDDMIPIATNDTVVTGLDLPIAINVFGNDTVMTLQEFFILEEPSNGDAMFLPGGAINYVPDPGYCDSAVPDSFTYVLCNPVGCDTATVFVFVQCTDLNIFTGFSPNHDGNNDFFVIQGLNLFGSHHLYIYNRWGERVFESENYQNNWDGTWEGKDLPDGTYFYILEIPGESTRTGYIQLHR